MNIWCLVCHLLQHSAAQIVAFELSLLYAGGERRTLGHSAEGWDSNARYLDLHTNFSLPFNYVHFFIRLMHRAFLCHVSFDASCTHCKPYASICPTSSTISDFYYAAIARANKFIIQLHFYFSSSETFRMRETAIVLGPRIIGNGTAHYTILILLNEQLFVGIWITMYRWAATFCMAEMLSALAEMYTCMHRCVNVCVSLWLHIGIL